MKLGALAQVQMGYPFRTRLEQDLAGDVAVIQMKDIDVANLVDLEGAIRVTLPRGKSRHLLRSGDLLFRSRGQSNGAAQVLDAVGAAVVAAPMVRIRPHSILPEYLCWFLNSPLARSQLAAVAEGSSVRMIRVEVLKDLEVPVPPEPVQLRLAAAAALADRERSALTRIAESRHRLTTHLLTRRARRASRKATS